MYILIYTHCWEKIKRRKVQGWLEPRKALKMVLGPTAGSLLGGSRVSKQAEHWRVANGERVEALNEKYS